MPSLLRLFRKDERFFDLLEAASEEARTSVILFAQYLQGLKNGGSPANLDAFVVSRREEKRLRIEMTAALSKTFITPIEREDIEALSSALYRIPKQVEKIVERMSICPFTIPLDGFQRQAQLMQEAVEDVAYMVHQLRNGASLERMSTANSRLQYAEGEADKVILNLLRDLHFNCADVKQLVILKELYELTEHAIDRCRTAGNVAIQIALKNS
jgi:uncharacterized protein Yka (UPF0111/DUF47 family)